MHGPLRIAQGLERQLNLIARNCDDPFARHGWSIQTRLGRGADLALRSNFTLTRFASDEAAVLHAFWQWLFPTTSREL